MENIPKPVIIGGIAVITIILIVIISNAPTKVSQPAVAEQQTAAEPQAEKSAQEIQNFYKAELIAQMKKRIDSLGPLFIEEKDEFRDLTFYYYKTQGKSWLNRNGIKPIVNSQGFIYFESNYYGGDWLFHRRAICLCGDLKMQTETIETFSAAHKTEIGNGNVWEINQYSNSLEFINAIASCPLDKEVKIRFEGDKIKDFVLSKTDRSAIAHAIEFQEAIATLLKN